ncbi:MAG: hypothetical protein ACKO5K_01725 [Armatimonadota bacterium]
MTHASLAVLAAALALAAPALAQGGPTTPAQPVGPGLAKEGRPLADVLRKMSDTTGLPLLAEGFLGRMPVSAGDRRATKENVEDLLDALVAQLPKAVWAKVMLPKPAEGKKYTGDAAAKYVRAQAALFGKVGASEAGMVEILGKRIATDRADVHVKGLGLVPYYVILSSNPEGARIADLAGPGFPVLGSVGSAVPDIMGPLLKQLGVSSPDQIPSGSYKVMVPGPDGTPTEAKIEVRNEGGGLSIGVSIGGR